MSNFVEQIETSLTSLVATAVPSYAELDHIYDIQQNNLNNNTDRYGVAVGSLVSSPDIIKYSTVDHTFQVVLTQGFISSQDDDTRIRTAINELHDKMDEILKDVYNKKAGLPALVLVVTLDSMSEPEILEDNVVALRMDLVVKYRRSIV